MSLKQRVDALDRPRTQGPCHEEWLDVLDASDSDAALARLYARYGHEAMERNRQELRRLVEGGAQPAPHLDFPDLSTPEDLEAGTVRCVGGGGRIMHGEDLGAPATPGPE